MDKNSLKRGILGGLAGGIPFGMMMGMMGMLPRIGGMLGMPNVMAGFAIHMMMSAMIGAVFGIWAVRFDSRRGVVQAGVAYGALWWVLGPLTFMPAIMGMGFAANWSAAGVSGSMPSLMGHMLYGLVLGLVFHRLGESGGVPATAVPNAG